MSSLATRAQILVMRSHLLALWAARIFRLEARLKLHMFGLNFRAVRGGAAGEKKQYPYVFHGASLHQ